MSRTAGVTVACALLASAWLAVVHARTAHADVIAAYVEGHGGLSGSEGDAPADVTSSTVSPALGFQIGARLMLFEAYFDRTAFTEGRTASRGIIGLRLGFGVAGLRLAVRGGVGGIVTQGGALTGGGQGAGDRAGVVARAGVVLEKRLKPRVFLIGLGIDGEAFSLDAPSGSSFSGRTQGVDVMTSLQLRFELGI